MDNIKQEPTVKLTPPRKAGDTVYCATTHQKFKVLQVTANGDLVCEGRAGIMPKEAALTELPKEED
jgi:hypothetical protein